MPDPLSRHRCCDRMEWMPVADFAHAGGFDFDLGRCAACGTYIMAVFHHPSTIYVVISDELAQNLLSLRHDPAQLKQALKKWWLD